MGCKIITFSGHAIQRMFERSISDSAVRDVITEGERIEEYPEDKPFPSILILGFVKRKPLHVVVGIDEKIHTCYVITVYEPDVRLWQSDFRKRKIL